MVNQHYQENIKKIDELKNFYSNSSKQAKNTDTLVCSICSRCKDCGNQRYTLWTATPIRSCCGLCDRCSSKTNPLPTSCSCRSNSSRKEYTYCKACTFLVEQFQSLRKNNPLKSEVITNYEQYPNSELRWLPVQDIVAADVEKNWLNNWGELDRDDAKALTQDTGVGIRIWKLFYDIMQEENFNWDYFYNLSDVKNTEYIKVKENMKDGDLIVNFYQKKDGSYIYNSNANNRVHLSKGLELPYFLGVVHY